MQNPHAVYAEAVRLFLETHGAASAGRLQYHITGKLEDIQQCLAQMVERGQLEQRGMEISGAYQGQPLYHLPLPFATEFATIERHLTGANEELLGLHRQGAMSYEEYAEIANLLIETRTRLKKQLQEAAARP